MERDLDLVRTLLLRVEAGPPFDFDVEARSEDEVLYHLALLVDADYLDGVVSRHISHDDEVTNISDVIVRGLTWRGHDLLDAIRNDSVWEAVKESVGEAVGTTSLSVVKTLAIEYTKKKLGLG